MRVAIGSDHAGYALKVRLVRELERLGHAVTDFGTGAAEPPVDYPDFCFPVAEAVSRGEVERGIVLGGSGIGESIAANKVFGVRAALVTSDETARLTRLHNDSNVLALGGRTNPGAEGVRCPHPSPRSRRRTRASTRRWSTRSGVSGRRSN
jgi:RpiB/LacA/LacB family sugar-phosphate isomerase